MTGSLTTDSRSQSMDPDRVLIEQTLAGDCSAYAELVARHEPKLRPLVLGIVADRHLVEDVLQEVFFQAYRYLETFRGECLFATWIYRVAVREAVRMQSRWQKLCRRFFPLSEPELVLERRADTKARTELDHVLHLLHELPSRQRAAFVLHVVDGRTHQQVADLLNTRPGTVGSWIHRARARIQARLAEADRPAAALLLAPARETS